MVGKAELMRKYPDPFYNFSPSQLRMMSLDDAADVALRYINGREKAEFPTKNGLTML